MAITSWVNFEPPYVGSYHQGVHGEAMRRPKEIS